MMHCDSRLTKAISEVASELGYTFKTAATSRCQQFCVWNDVFVALPTDSSPADAGC